MGSQPEKVLQHQALERVKSLSHLFDPDPEKPEKISPASLALPLPPGLPSRGAAWEELARFLSSQFSSVRRLAASALGKMAPEHPPAVAFLPALLRVAQADTHPQVRQYAIKSIGRYPADAFFCLEDLKDIAREESAPSYVTTAAAEAIAVIQTEHREHFAKTHHWCARCKRIITEEEFFRGMDRWGKPYCRHCMDERDLENKNFEATVEGAKNRRSFQGTAVQSRGEKEIADFLERESISYVYDERYRIAGEDLIRPDFYLPEFDVYIEYFGMNTPEYRDNMLKKRILYQRAGKKLVSLSYKDYDNLIPILKQKLSRYIRLSPPLTPATADTSTEGPVAPATDTTAANGTAVMNGSTVVEEYGKSSTAPERFSGIKKVLSRDVFPGVGNGYKGKTIDGMDGANEVSGSMEAHREAIV